MSVFSSCKFLKRSLCLNSYLHHYYSGTALVTGSNRGLGLEFCFQLIKNEYKVFACCRNPNDANELKDLQATATQNQLIITELDSTNDEHICALSKSLKDIPIDILILNAGTKGSITNHTLGLLQRDEILNTININCVGPLLIAQALFENVKASKRKQIVGITSLMGSIVDNNSGNRVSYRVSKTALNSVFQEIKLKGNEFGIHTLLLHPGWVKTNMGGPNAKISTFESVQSMLNVIDNAQNFESGALYNFEGEQLPW
eukprot:98968_1